MQIIITGVHMDMTDAIREYSLEKMTSLDKFISKDDTSARLNLELSKTTTHHTHGAFFQAEAQLHLSGKDTTLRTTQDDLYKAIDVLKDMLSRELVQHKSKERSVFRKSAHKLKSLFKKLP
ncbi:ribosome-associated translation inhibitor RaiA [Candidatus Gracilibacteria bacterium]|nr:ribosome-associated translation inhibitor RaiA [Candidatus Gracilibacteria bacterium]MCF7898678.1 ribosome-associated translation inhibitor RaiA [Candidatus Paceibacterota bacterium]